MAAVEVHYHWSPGSGRILPLGTVSLAGGRGGAAHHGPRGPTLHSGLQLARLLWPWGFSRQEYWNGFPCLPPGDLLNPGIKPTVYYISYTFSWVLYQ